MLQSKVMNLPSLKVLAIFTFEVKLVRITTLHSKPFVFKVFKLVPVSRSLSSYHNISDAGQRHGREEGRGRFS